MSSKERKILDVSVAPQKLTQFRESLQGGFDTCDAKAYAEYIAEDVKFFCYLFLIVSNYFLI